MQLPKRNGKMNSLVPLDFTGSWGLKIQLLQSEGEISSENLSSKLNL
jgi:hypothetical protein